SDGGVIADFGGRVVADGVAGVEPADRDVAGGRVDGDALEELGVGVGDGVVVDAERAAPGGAVVFGPAEHDVGVGRLAHRQAVGAGALHGHGMAVGTGEAAVAGAGRGDVS